MNIITADERSSELVIEIEVNIPSTRGIQYTRPLKLLRLLPLNGQALYCGFITLERASLCAFTFSYRQDWSD